MSAKDPHCKSANDSGHSITIIDSVTISALPNKSLLECLEANNLPVQYHCREGFCGACRTTLVAGEVHYKTYPLAFMDDDECLPCCCQATTDLTLKLNP